MVNINALGIIFPNTYDELVPQLVKHRTMASVPFGGRYRMIDFTLSGMVNAGIENVTVIAKKNYHSLMDHLGSGREWDLVRKRGGLNIVPPYAQSQSKVYHGRVEALYSIVNFLAEQKEKYVVISDCNVASDLNFAHLIDAHVKSGANVTMVYERAEIAKPITTDNYTFTMDDAGRVTEIRWNDYRMGVQNLSMGVIVMDREELIAMVKDAAVQNRMYLERDILGPSLKILHVQGYEYSGYRARIYDIKSYFDENMRLLCPENVAQLFPTERPVYTKVRDEAPVRYTYTGPAIYTEEDKFQKISFDDISDKSGHVTKTDNGWIAMIQHYFISAWTDVRGETGKHEREFYTSKLDQNLFAVGSILKLGTVEPKQSVNTAATLYVGPQDQNRLSYLADGLDLVVDYGWLTFLAKPIYSILNFMYGLCGNWGWSIVLLTVLVKLILYPISAAGYKSMARMKEITPRMKALQEQYGQDKQRYQQAIMELYRKEKINPIGGCLPILLQIPVFLALYWVLLASVELRDSAWLGWVSDLASPDPWFILPAIMMATMFLQIKLNPTPTDPMQAKMMVIMPLVFGVMFFFFPAGLVLYWLTNNVLSIAQQWYVNKQIAKERAKRLNAVNQ